MASHAGYGALLGACDGARAAGQALPAPLAGAGYGLLVWAASYAGWLPALGVVRPPWREPRSRMLQLVAAHLIWGMRLDWLIRWKMVR